MEIENIEEKPVSKLYEVQVINKKVHLMEIPEGIVYMIDTDGSGKRPLFVEDSTRALSRLDGFSERIKPEMEKCWNNWIEMVEKSQQEYREKVEEQDGEPISYISLEARAILHELTPELIKIISEKLVAHEESMKKEEPPKKEPKTTKTKTPK